MTDPTLPPIDSVGQRRQPNGSFPGGGGGGTGGGDDGGTSPDPQDVPDTGEGGPYQGGNPCNSPATAREWNADATTSRTTKDLLTLAQTQFPNESGFNDREYGAALWELPSGEVVPGPFSYGEYTFYEAAQRASQGLEAHGTVVINYSPPLKP